MDPGPRLLEMRLAAGLTQAELASRSGVSRQLIGAIEAGRHLPRVDGALAIAAALEVPVARLFGASNPPVDILSGEATRPGSLVRVSAVGEQVVTTEAKASSDGYDIADGLMERDGLARFPGTHHGFVVAGCEPGLALLERLLRERAEGGVSVTTSTAGSLAALDGGRAHAAVVHGRPQEVATHRTRRPVARYHLAQWQVGLAAPLDAPPGWPEAALAGKTPVIQREAGAGVQHTFESIRSAAPPVRHSLTAGSHLEAAWRAVWTGFPAVTIEPAALAAGADFRPLEEHEAQLWILEESLGEPPVISAMEVINGRRFQRRLAAVGGYDLSRIGSRVEIV